MRTVLQSWGRRLPTGFGPVPRAPIDGLRPDDVKHRTLALVLDRLAAAGVTHSVIVPFEPTRTAVAVPAEQRSRAVAALAAGRTPAHLRLQTPDRNGVFGTHLFSTRALASVTARHVGDSGAVRVMSLHGESDGGVLYDARYGCDVEFWPADPDRPGWRSAPQRNGFASTVEESLVFDTVTVTRHGRPLPVARAVADLTRVDDVTFPVDVVYLWVDGSDPAWSERLHRHRGTTAEVRPDSERFRQMEELRYSLRSLDMYAPWVRNVFIVTDDQRPSFLRPDDRLQIVDHRDIADDLGRLPTFNSDVISSWMHRIPGLSEHFLFLNDDMFFGRDVQPNHFFTPAGQIRVFPSRLQRPLGPVTDRDDLPNAKAKNLSAVIEERFGRRPVNIVRHTPYPMTRSLVQMVEQRLAAEIEATRSHRFREPTDTPIEQAVHYIGQVTGDAVRSTIGYGYMNITSSRGVDELRRLAIARDKEVFCLNDAPDRPDAVPDVDLVRSLLDTMFPVPSRWEVD